MTSPAHKEQVICTSNMTGRHRGPKHKLRAGLACAAHFCKFFKFSVHLRVAGYSFPFHVHILCIWYGNVLANTAVLCMCVHIFCWPVCGAPGECYYNTYVAKRFFIFKCGIACFLCAMHVFEFLASSLPRLPFCQILFLWPLLLS